MCRFVPHARGRYDGAFEAGPTRTKAPIGILVDEKKALVQQADLPCDACAKKKRRATHVLGAVDSRGISAQAAPYPERKTPPWRAPLGARAPEALRIVHVEDPGTEAACARVSLRSRDQLVQQHRIDRRIVVQHKDEIRAALERVANAEVVAPGISEIPARLNDLDVRRSYRTRERDERSVGQAVVNDDDTALGVMQIAHVTTQATVSGNPFQFTTTIQIKGTLAIAAATQSPTFSTVSTTPTH